MVLWHPRTSWGLRDRIFSKKSCQKAPNKRPPPWLVDCVINDSKKSKILSWDPGTVVTSALLFWNHFFFDQHSWSGLFFWSALVIRTFFLVSTRDQDFFFGQHSWSGLFFWSALLISTFFLICTTDQDFCYDLHFPLERHLQSVREKKGWLDLGACLKPTSLSK